MNDQCALTPPYEAVEDMLKLMERGARMRLDCIPDDPTLLSASFGTAHTPEMAKVIRDGQEKRDREIRNKAYEEACNTIERLSTDKSLAGCSPDLILSFASDLVQSLKEDAPCDDLKAGWRPIETAPKEG